MERGQKTADAIAEAGFTAYSYMASATNADKADYRLVAGRKVMIAPDNDLVGLKAAYQSALAVVNLNGEVLVPRKSSYSKGQTWQMFPLLNELPCLPKGKRLEPSPKTLRIWHASWLKLISE